MRQKGFAPIIILLVLVVVALMGIAYFAGTKSLFKNNTPLVSLTSPSPVSIINQTDNWKVYTNSTFGYSVKIPSDWEAVRQTGDDSVISVRPVGASNIPVIFNAQDNAKNIPLNTWIDNQLGKDYPREVRKLNNYDAVFVNNTTTPYEYNVYYLANKSVVYELSGSTLDKNQLDVFNQIISTFKFN